MPALPDILSWAGAPAALVAWVGARDEAEIELLDLSASHLDALLSRSPRAAWVPWLAASASVPMELVVAASGLAIESRSGEHPLVCASLEEAYAVVAGESSGEAVLDAAVRCDELAASPPRGFRDGGERIAMLARSTALVLRAAEAVSAVIARDEAERMQRTRQQVARFGGGVSAWVERSARPTVLAMRAISLGGAPAPPTPELAFAADALGQALDLVAGAVGDAEVRDDFVAALA